MTRPPTTGLSVTPRLRLCASCFLAPSTGIAPPGSRFSPQTPVLTVTRSFGLRSGLTPIRGSLLSLARALTKMAEDPYPLLALPQQISRVQMRARVLSAGQIAVRCREVVMLKVGRGQLCGTFLPLAAVATNICFGLDGKQTVSPREN